MNICNTMKVKSLHTFLIIFLLVCDSITKIFCKDINVYLSKYLDSTLFSSKFGISFEDCKDECLSMSRCTSVNYSRRQQLCQLTKGHSQEPTVRHGWVYSYRSFWDQSPYANCECEDTEKCNIIDADNTSCQAVQCSDPNQVFVKLRFVGNMYSVGGIAIAKCSDTKQDSNLGARMICTLTGEWNWIGASVNCDEGIEVFKGFKKKNGIYQSYMNAGYASGDSNEACLLTPVPANCTKHYRSQLIDEWETLLVSKVLFSIVKDGEQVQYVLFDGFNSSKESWFSADRIIQSSWIDLPTSEPVTVRLRGKVGKFSDGFNCWLRRRFIIVDGESSLSNCSTDKSWFFATLANGRKACCNYDIFGDTHLIYSKLNTSVNFNSYRDIGYADYVIIKIFTGIDI